MFGVILPPWLIIVLGIVAAACFASLPWAHQIDKRHADKREAAGKPLASAPKWVIYGVIIVLFVGGIALYNIR